MRCLCRVVFGWSSAYCATDIEEVEDCTLASGFYCSLSFLAALKSYLSLANEVMSHRT
jgi:hypothetical protein